MKISKKDFIEIEYTGKLKDDNIVFDTTDKKVAEENKIYDEKISYGPVTICVGESQIVAGLDKALEGKETEKNYVINLAPNEAFGEKNAKLMKLVPLSMFRKQGMQPFVGLQVNIDNVIGTIRTITGGRVIVDFNHPLSGRDLAYNVKVNRLVTDKKEQLASLLKMLGIKEPKIELNEGKAIIELEQELPNEAKEELAKKLKETVEIKEIEFVKLQKEKVNKQVIK
ncbi:FKBP-type peptidyl-prolyl cis-trans isomerase [Candidatus Woesearchaeota archaeon]|nr:FKBP-type peptidyl-prolyl cis-trans isomerase [Candidatus Woesearchaeota archaeon]